MIIRAFTILVAWFAPWVVSTAQEASDTTYALPEVTVVATRDAIVLADNPAHVSRFDRDALSASPGSTLGDFLSRVSAGFVRQYGPGGLASLSIRGTSPSQTTLLLDGMRLDDPQLGQIDLSLLPTAILQDVEVLHGGASAVYGSDAVGGVISMSTRRPQGGTRVELTSRLGAWTERAVGIVVSGASRKVDGVVSIDYGSTKGDFSYLDASSFPSRDRRRVNADRATFNAMGKVRVRHRLGISELSSWVMDAERGLPGSTGTVDGKARQWDRRARVWFQHLLADGSGETEMRLAVDGASLRYANPRLNVDDTGRTSSISGELMRKHRLERIHFQAGGSLTMHRATHPSLASESGQSTIAGFLAASMRAGKWIFYPAVRADGVSRSGRWDGEVSPSLRLRWRPGSDDHVILRSGVTRTFRAPTLNDLFWKSAGASGNERLLSERGISVDVGVALHRRRMNAQLTGFLQAVRNQITWLPTDSGLWTPTNVGRVRSMGLEASLDRQFVVGSSADVIAQSTYTLTHATDRSDAAAPSFGKPLRYVPQHQFGLDIRAARDGLSTGLSARWTDRRFVTTDGSSWLSSFLVVDARVGMDVRLGSALIRADLFLENLSGAEYQVIAGYPMPPRHLRLHLAAIID